MDDARLGRLIRALRHRRQWRQVDLAERARVGHDAVVKLEAGRIGPMRTASIRAIVSVFGLSYEPVVRGLGADEDRLIDERHATILGACATWLRTLGWLVAAEVSYSEFGERGSVDLLAWHPASASLLVIEIKSELASLETTLRKLDEKVRLASRIARPFGWRPTSIGRLLVLPEDRTQRRRVAAHAAVLDQALPIRSSKLRAWCREPSGPIAGLLFLAETRGSPSTARGRRKRIRLCDVRSRSSGA
ncbi:MAG TPA: helix-turn-helix transcriptional regulator [Candidatus Limnocylindrales bacterium]|nr:helix-turn-helix transcriptional regulator [Candidatus Limnocylindrales bacterium]